MTNLFKNLFAKSKKKQPEDDFVTVITEESVCVEHPRKQSEQILWKDIEVIKLINTDSGPAAPDLWLALLGSHSGCLIPHGSIGFDKVYQIISKYDNFDFESVTESMRSTENREFLLWERKKDGLPQ